MFNYRRLRCFTTYVQKLAPEFSAKLVQSGQIIPNFTKSDLLKSPLNTNSPGYALLIFYPLDFTFVCPTELTAYSDRIEEFHSEGCRIVGISVDSEYSHLQWIKQSRSVGGLLSEDPAKGFKLPLLSDLTKEISKNYGVLSANGSVSLRAQILIDPTGTIRHHSVNDLGIGRSVDESLRLVRAVKWVDEMGEVCPVNWNKGDKAINPLKASDYFKTNPN